MSFQLWHIVAASFLLLVVGGITWLVVAFRRGSREGRTPNTRR